MIWQKKRIRRRRQNILREFHAVMQWLMLINTDVNRRSISHASYQRNVRISYEHSHTCFFNNQFSLVVLYYLSNTQGYGAEC